MRPFGWLAIQRAAAVVLFGAFLSACNTSESATTTEAPAARTPASVADEVARHPWQAGKLAAGPLQDRGPRFSLRGGDVIVSYEDGRIRSIGGGETRLQLASGVRPQLAEGPAEVPETMTTVHAVDAAGERLAVVVTSGGPCSNADPAADHPCEMEGWLYVAHADGAVVMIDHIVGGWVAAPSFVEDGLLWLRRDSKTTSIPEARAALMWSPDLTQRIEIAADVPDGRSIIEMSNFPGEKRLVIAVWTGSPDTGLFDLREMVFDTKDLEVSVGPVLRAGDISAVVWPAKWRYVTVDGVGIDLPGSSGGLITARVFGCDAAEVIVPRRPVDLLGARSEDVLVAIGSGLLIPGGIDPVFESGNLMSGEWAEVGLDGSVRPTGIEWEWARWVAVPDSAQAEASKPPCPTG